MGKWGCKWASMAIALFFRFIAQETPTISNVLTHKGKIRIIIFFSGGS